ncbi:MAG: hypothetical protein K0S37_4212 [Microbacterium sp.]|nr:hypothetical protein [Microbacterium sp.]
MGIVRLSRATRTRLVEELKSACRRRGLSNVFNPSALPFEDRLLIAFRAESFPGERPFRAYLFERSASGERIVDLTESARQHGFDVVADPKLVRLGDDVYATFNTGTLPVETNQLAIMKVFPEVGAVQRCDFKGRQRTEKNWAFYIGSDDELRVLYSLSPVRVLQLSGGELGQQGNLAFEEVSVPVAAGRANSGWHIGAQLCPLDSDTALTVVHRKVKLLRWNAYFARLARVSLTGRPRVQLSRTVLLHSWASLIPRRGRPNSRLLFATYFSGLALRGQDLLLSYGINDVDFGIVEIPIQKVWK